MVTQGVAAAPTKIAAEQAIPAALGQGGAGETVLGMLLAGENPLAARAGRASPAGELRSLSSGKPETIDGVAVETVVATRKQPEGGEETLRFAIGREDHLLRQVTVTGTAKGLPFTRIETHSNVRVNPILPEAMFVAGAAPIAGAAPAGQATITNTPVTEDARYDFGEVSLLDTTSIEHRFTFKNTGATPLKIERLAATCGCTSTIVGSSGTGAYPTLAPGEETTINVTVNLLPLRPGAQHKSVSVYAEGNAQPVARYEIQGTLLPTVAFSPQILDFGPVGAGETRSIPLTATINARLAAEGALPPLVASHPAIRIRPSPETKTSAGSKTVTRVYTVSLAPDAPLGPLTGSITFAPAGSSGAAGLPSRLADALGTSSVFVVGQVSGAVSAQPQAVAFGAVASGQGATRQVVLTGANPTALKNRKVTSDSPWLTVGPGKRDDQAPLSETIEVALRPNAPTGVLQTRLVITLENGQRLLLPVSAYVTGAAF